MVDAPTVANQESTGQVDSPSRLAGRRLDSTRLARPRPVASRSPPSARSARRRRRRYRVSFFLPSFTALCFPSPSHSPPPLPSFFVFFLPTELCRVHRRAFAFLDFAGVPPDVGESVKKIEKEKEKKRDSPYLECVAHRRPEKKPEIEKIKRKKKERTTREPVVAWLCSTAK